MRKFMLVTCALLIGGSALAVPYQFSHQGRMFDQNGDALTGYHSVNFTLHDTPAGGSPFWTETHTAEFTNGYFAVTLGSTNPLDPDQFDTDTVYLGMAIDGGAPLPTRPKLTSVPWALHAETATNVSGGVVDASEIRINGSTVIDPSGDVDVDWSDIQGMPADFADGVDDGFAAPLCTNGEILVNTGSGWDCAAPSAHDHNASAIVGGTLDIGRLPVGDTTNTVAAGDHAHSGDDITSGTVAFGRLPVGTTGSTIAAGDHAHNGIESLSCADGESPEFVGSSWQCVTGGSGGGGGGLLLNFELDETVGPDFADTSGGGNDASAPAGGLAAGSAGHSVRGIDFSGGVVEVGSGNSISHSPHITAEAWISPELPLTGNKVVLHKQGGFLLRQVDDKVEFTATAVNAECSVSTGSALSAGAWHHVEGSYNGRTIEVSVDDIQFREICAEGPLTDTTGAPFTIGADNTSGSPADTFKGTIDEVRIWGFGHNDDGFAGLNHLYNEQIWRNEQIDITTTGWANTRALTYDKQYTDTILRINYQEQFTIRAYNQWNEVKLRALIDGAECTDPGKIEMRYPYYSNSGDKYHSANLLLQHPCRATTNGPLGTGSHTVQIQAGRGYCGANCWGPYASYNVSGNHADRTARVAISEEQDWQ